MGINKIIPKYLKPETSIWKTRNNPSKGHDKNAPLNYDTVSSRKNPPKGHNKNISLVYYKYLTVYFVFKSIKSKEEPITGNPMELTTEAENETNREAVLKRLEIILVNTSSTVWKDSTQSKTKTPHLQIGDSLR